MFEYIMYATRYIWVLRKPLMPLTVSFSVEWATQCIRIMFYVNTFRTIIFNTIELYNCI